MKVIAAQAFLPAPDTLPAVIRTVAGELESFYADVLTEPAPEHIMTLIRRLDGPQEGRHLVLIVGDEADLRALAIALLEETELEGGRRR